MRTKVRHLPARAATGAFIFESGRAKLQADDDTAKQLHSMASGAYPALAELDPHVFARGLGIAEMSLGGALLVPMVPTGLAALGLGAFSSGLLGMYMRTPEMHRRGSIRPTGDGVALAKDSWMLGAAMTMLLDTGTWRRSRRKARANAKDD